jgi:WD40 repeat protein
MFHVSPPKSAPNIHPITSVGAVLFMASILSGCGDPRRGYSAVLVRLSREFLPDGRHFLFVAISDRPDNDSIFVGDIQAKPDPKNVRRLMSGAAHVSYAPPGYLLFPRDNRLTAQAFDGLLLELTGEPFTVADKVDAGLSRHTSDFSVSASGVLAWRTQPGTRRQLAWFDRGGKQIEGFPARESYLSPRLSPDGKRVAAGRQDPAQEGIMNIWLLDLVRGSKSRFTFGIGLQSYSIWSPDGQRIVFDLEKADAWGLYWKDVSGAGDEELLLKTGQRTIPTDWSSDGRFILFSQEDPKTKWDIWVLPLFGDRKPVPVLKTEFVEGLGVFSPDGRWIAYCSNESGRTEVYVRSFAEGSVGAKASTWPVSTAGGFWPRWRRDGKEIFFNAPDGKLMAIPVKTGSTFEAGIPVMLFDTHDNNPLDFGFDVRPDGKRFLISGVFGGDAARPVNICTNWLAGVKK